MSLIGSFSATRMNNFNVELGVENVKKRQGRLSKSMYVFAGGLKASSSRLPERKSERNLAHQISLVTDFG